VSRTQLLDLRGTRVRVRDEGDGPPLLLINGLGSNIEGWDPLTRLLPGRRIIAFDAPGTGASPPLPRPARLPQLADLVAELLDAVDCPRADVLGFSFGGALAQQLARCHPSRVRRLILAGTIPGTGGLQNPLAVLRVLDPRRVAQLHMHRPYETIAPLVGGVTRRDPAAYDAYEDARLAHPPSYSGYAMQVLALCGWSSIPWLHTIAHPTLVLAGDDDPLVPLVNSSIFVRLMPDCRRHVVRGGGHLFPVDEPESVAGIIDEFLAEGALVPVPVPVPVQVPVATEVLDDCASPERRRLAA
jgi:poly(3-hydroxyoctanoate) depolymerase